METSPAGIVTVDAEGSITYANNRAEQILGLKKEEITKRTYDEPLWKHTDLDGNPFPDEKQPFYIVKTTQRSVYGIQHGIVWPDGKTVILSINASPMKDSAGNFRGIIATFEDITSRKRAEETILHQLKEKEILLKEVHHRVKNNISSIEGMLYIQMDGASSREAKKILKTAIGRVQSMRVIYDKLLWSSDYKDDSAVNYFEELVTAIKKIFPEKNKISVETRIDDFRLDIEVLFSLGTIVNELITNSIKHAFRNSDSGRIEILLEKNKNEISLTVRDNGKGIPADFKIEKTGSFGLMLVRMLSDQLKGALTIDNSDGAKFMLKFKIENG
jgi:PAS domain S-box-containing protein